MLAFFVSLNTIYLCTHLERYTNSLVLPRLTYGILAWGTNQSHLFKLQKKAIRIVTNSKFNKFTET